MDIECFLAEPINRVAIELRRYVSSVEVKCSGHFGYHNASVVIAEKDKVIPEERYEKMSDEQIANDDPRWPKTCPCGYEFQDADERQINEHRLYAGKGQRFTLRDAPAGAMWDAWWMGEQSKGPDGVHLVVQTPGGEWMPDSPSRNPDGTQGASWTRTGTLPVVTVRPSILMRNYHGFLTDGVLRDA